MKLEGTLDMFPLRELLDMIVYSSVTGVLNIYGPGDAGYLYFRESTLYHIERGQVQGIDALAELFELSNASFSFVSDAVSERESLYGTLSTHVQAAERAAARWRQVRPYVPSVDLIPQLLVPRESAARRVGPDNALVFAAIDGRASVRQIAATVGWATIDIAEAIGQLSLDGLVDLRSGRHQPAAHAPVEHPDPCRASEGLFDRILSRAQV